MTRGLPTLFGDFKCQHCQALVSVVHELSGVNNRNHCPYCLWSRHLDLYQAGDRLSACRGSMQPIGLTLKKTRNKYARGLSGELMLIHACQGCQALSINRIAVDDDVALLVEVFEESLGSASRWESLRLPPDIILLTGPQEGLLQTQLFGRQTSRSQRRPTY